MNTTEFELHVVSVFTQTQATVPAVADLLKDLRRRPTAAAPQVISIPSDGTPIGLANTAGQLKVDDPGAPDELAQFSMIEFAGSAAVAMTTYRPDVYVNSVPALRLSVLTVKDCVRFRPGIHAFLTQRIRPYVGKPPKSILGDQCPYCRIPFNDATQVAFHECNVAYHHETEQSHPDLPETERLACFTRLKHCLSCQHEMRLDERLVWDPAEAV